MLRNFEIDEDPNPYKKAQAPRHSAASRPGLVRWAASMLLPLAVGACSSVPGAGTAPQKEPTQLDIAIEAARDVNVDLQGRGAPMLLRVYELKSDVAFQDADFFSLQNTDKAALGADLLGVDQFILRPGETRQIVRKSNPEATVIGVFAAYRDLPNAVWRVIYKMQPAPDASWIHAVLPANKAKLKIALQANAIVMTDEEAAKRASAYANELPKGVEQAPAATVKP